MIAQVEERFNNYEKDRLHFVCPLDGEGQRCRSKFVIPRAELEGLRSLGFSGLLFLKCLAFAKEK